MAGFGGACRRGRLGVEPGSVMDSDGGNEDNQVLDNDGGALCFEGLTGPVAIMMAEVINIH